MKFFRFVLPVVVVFSLLLSGCNSGVTTNNSGVLPTDKPIPIKDSSSIGALAQNKIYTFKEFKRLYLSYLKESKIPFNYLSENDGYVISKEEKPAFYKVTDITPLNVKEEIGCKIFKVNSNCESYLFYKSKFYRIGNGYGGFGIVSMTTCDFDQNGEKDLIYTFSFGSGIHRTEVGVFNLTTNTEEVIKNDARLFVSLKEFIIEKSSDISFEIYNANILEYHNLEYTNLKLDKGEHIADIQLSKGKIEIESKFNAK
ncbi:MAG: hypothetical protein WCQ41_01005 [Bacillota bacterium]